MNKKITQLVIEAAINLKEHGCDCGCSNCARDAEIIKNNPEVVSVLTPALNRFLINYQS